MENFLERNNLRIKSWGLWLFSLFILMINLNQPPIYILDEAKNAECAREMMLSDNFIVPYFNLELRTDKPPLHYFFMVLAYKIFGVSSFSARFFSVIFGASAILISFLFSRKFLGERIAWLTAIVLLTSLHFTFQMRLAVSDPYLIFWMCGSFMSFFLFLSGKKKHWLWLMYIAFGLGFLTKGPIAIALPALIMLVFLLITRRFNWPLIRSFNLGAGVLIVLLVAFPWYALNYFQSHGVWTREFFLYHNLGRFSETMEGHRGFFLLPLFIMIVGLLPMGAFLIQSLWFSWKKRDQELVLFCFLITVITVLFFSVSKTQLPNYTVPAYPFAAILIAVFLDEISRKTISVKGIGWSYFLYSIFAVAIPLAVYFGLKADADLKTYRYLWIFFLALPLGLLPGWYFLVKKRFNYLLATMILSFFISNFFFFWKAYPAVYSANPVSVSLPLVQKKEHLVYYKMLNPAYIFTLQQTIPRIGDLTELKNYVRQNPDAVIISRKEFMEEILSTGDFKLIFEQRNTLETPVTVIFTGRRRG
ncbi:MAG TPA: glycosyltransferase family 39 protein [Daejeonella sp.]|nr:glycosyltransferase family 39 protein [Daejeonella sp.]